MCISDVDDPSGYLQPLMIGVKDGQVTSPSQEACGGITKNKDQNDLRVNYSSHQVELNKRVMSAIVRWGL